MKAICVNLELEQIERLRLLSKRTHVPVSVFVRQSVDTLLNLYDVALEEESQSADIRIEDSYSRIYRSVFLAPTFTTDR